MAELSVRGSRRDRRGLVKHHLSRYRPALGLASTSDDRAAFVAAALAARAVREARARSGETILDARIRFESHLVLSRDPTGKELAVLRGLFGETASTPTTPSLKNASMRFEEKSTQRQENPTMELSGLKAVSSALLNLDAAMNR